MNFLSAFLGVASIVEGVSMVNMLKHHQADTGPVDFTTLTGRAGNVELLLQQALTMAGQSLPQMVRHVPGCPCPACACSQYLKQYPQAARQTVNSQLQSFYAAKEQAFGQLSSGLMQQRDQFFQRSHYQFTTSGDPVLDDRGIPVAEANPDGAPEPAEAKSKRLAWEERQYEKVDRQYQADREQIVAKTTADLRSVVTSHVSQLGNPEVQQQMQQLVGQAEQQLRILEQQRQVDLMKAGLPTYEMKKQLADAAGRFREDEERFLADLEASPAGRELREYQQMVHAFLMEQKRQMADSNDSSSVATNPSLLAYLVPSSNDSLLADGIQEMVRGVSAQYTFRA